MKNNIDKILGHDPWEIEAAFYVKHSVDPQDARILTIRRYMEFNDLRPLRDAIAKAKPIDDRMVAIDAAILGDLVELIDQGRLLMKLLSGGRPKSPDLFARDLVGALRYEKRMTKSDSDTAFRETASELGMTEKALREAVTRWHKANAG